MMHIDKIEEKSIVDSEENYENITISTRNCLGVLKQEMCVCLIFCFILDGGWERKIDWQTRIVLITHYYHLEL